jgi:glycosyltransferase involved in cell wall biosynthesis
MQDLRFSIVIPTRERAETLKYCLKTCIKQKEFENYEIVVSDNNSSPATKQVVDDLYSDKIRYYSTGKTLAMHENFEFALSKAKGEYVIFLGDDDGMLLNGLNSLDQIIKKTNYKAIAWDWILYYWPDGGPPGLENLAIISLLTNARIMNGKELIKEVIAYKQPYPVLPMIYVNGAIHRDLISELRTKAGKVFLSVTPDVCSGICFAYLSENYLYLDQPLSIAAISGKGNGNNQFNKRSNKITNEFNTLNDSSSIQFNTKIPNIRSMNVVVSEAFLQAKEKLFERKVFIKHVYFCC